MTKHTIARSARGSVYILYITQRSAASAAARWATGCRPLRGLKIPLAFGSPIADLSMIDVFFNA